MMNKEWIQANKEKSQIFGVIGGCFIIISITLIAMSAILKQTKLLFILFIILGTQLVCIRKRNHFIISSTIYLFTINTSILYFACIFGKESNLQILYYALFTIGFSLYLGIRNNYLLFNSCVILTYIFILEVSNFSLINHIQLTENQNNTIRFLTIIYSIIIIGIALIYQYKTNNTTTNSLMPPQLNPINNYNFTKRETDIIKQLIQGKTNKEISNSLFIEESTVKSHLKRIFQKTNVSNRGALISLMINE